MKSLLESNLKQYNELQGEYAAVKAESEEKQRTIDDLLKEKSSVEGSNAVQKSALQESIKQYSLQLEALKVQYSRATSELTDSRMARAELDRQGHHLKTQLATLEMTSQAEIQQARLQAKNLKEDLDNVQRRLAQTVGEKDRVLQDLKASDLVLAMRPVVSGVAHSC